MNYTLFILTILLSLNIHSEVKKTKEQVMAEAKEFAEKERKKAEAQVQVLIKEREAAKTDKEKAEFNRKLQESIQKNDQNLVTLSKRRKVLFFKLLYDGIKQTANENKVLPETLDHKKIYSRIDLNTVNYIGGLSTKSKDSKNTILVYEKKADEYGNRHILFLDGHVEISKEIK